MRNLFTFLLVVFLFTTVNAQFQRIKDINPGTSAGNPAEMIVHNGTIFFKATNGTAGLELWKSDGSEAGTVMVKDIKSGTSGSSPTEFFVYNNQLYFSAVETSGSTEFKSDGTEAGTVNLGLNKNIFKPVEMGGKMYFINSTASNALSIFTGTTYEAATNSTTETANVVGAVYTDLGDKLLLYMGYSADQPTIGRELYMYDPAVGLYSLVKDVVTGVENSSITNLTTIASNAFFTSSGILWETSGTEASTTIVASAATAAITGITSLFAWKRNLYFEGDDGTGDQLWMYNPTAKTVTKISNITGTNPDHDPSDFAEYGNYLYYSAKDGNDANKHLWRTNGTTTTQLDESISAIDDIVVYNHTLCMEGNESTAYGNELYMYTLTKKVVFRITDGISPIEGVTVKLSTYDAVTTNASGEAIFEYVEKDENLSYTTYKNGYLTINGSILNTYTDKDIQLTMRKLVIADINLVKDINAGAAGNSNPAEMIVHNGTIFFKATNGTAGVELWKSDGSEAGTVMVKDIKSGTSGSSPTEFFVYNNQLYFSAVETTGNTEFKSDGTEAGTVNLGLSKNIFKPVELGGKVYFINSTASNALSVFTGTTFEAATNSTSETANVLGAVYTALGDKLLLYMSYSADQPTIGRELYMYDPAVGLYSLVKDVVTGTGTDHGVVANLTTVGTKAYFTSNGLLWETNGTDAGTTKVAAATTASITGVTSLFAANENLYFEGDDGTGDQLWVLNTATGAVTKISNVSGTNTDHDPSDYVVYGKYVYYSAKDGFDTNKHLWRANGTITEQLDEIIIDVDDIVVMNHTLYFEGEKVDVTGNELFKFYVGEKQNVQFTVTDGAAPLANATIALTGYTSVTTNQNGVANIAGVSPADNIPYTITLNDYNAVNGTVTVSTTDVSVTKSLELITYSVKFVVTDGTSPLSSATVQLTGYDVVTTNTSGEAIINQVVPATDIQYTISLTGYQNATGTVTLTNADVFKDVVLTIINSLESDVESQFQVYPVPASDVIYVEFKEAVQATLTLRDVSGRTIETVKTHQSLVEFNVAHLAKGIYLLDVQSDNQRFAKKLVIQ